MTCTPGMQHDDLRPVILRRRSSSDLAKQKFGTMPLVPLHGDSTDATMLSANQTLVRAWCQCSSTHPCHCAQPKQELWVCVPVCVLHAALVSAVPMPV